MKVNKIVYYDYSKYPKLASAFPTENPSANPIYPVQDAISFIKYKFILMQFCAENHPVKKGGYCFPVGQFRIRVRHTSMDGSRKGGVR